MPSLHDIRWVLVAEDDDDIREMIVESIRAENEAGESPSRLEVVEARNGQEAMDYAAARQFHCVVTDLKMPKVTGDEFIRELQSQPLNSNTPTLVVSSHAQDEFRDFCERFAHISVIAKPFEPQTVAQAVIRELKLGRLDDRIAIHLLTPIIDSVRTVLNSHLDLTSDHNDPAIKKSGEKVDGDCHCSVTLSTGISRARFCLSFDRGLLEYARKHHFRERYQSLGELSLESVASYMIHAIFDNASPRIRVLMGGTPKIGGLSIINSKNEHAMTELTLTTGIKVLITTDLGLVHAGAFSRMKTSSL
jgi:two-component system chemotaxis response regulator CheY